MQCNDWLPGRPLIKEAALEQTRRELVLEVAPTAEIYLVPPIGGG